MKLVSYASDDGARIGVLLGEEVVDLRRALASSLAAGGDQRSDERAAALIPSDMTAFLEGGPASLDNARRAIAWATAGHRQPGIVSPLADMRLLAPVPKPPKVFGIGGNYPDLTSTWPTPPGIPPMFQRARTSIMGPQDDVVLPSGVTYMQPEMELCVVIGTRCRSVPQAEAYEVICGYMIGNDISDIDAIMSHVVTRMRPDLEELGLPTEAPYNLGLAFQAKAWDFSCPTGPYLVTADEIDPNNLDFEFRVNGEVMQRGNTRDMLVKIPRMIEWLSATCTLEPGDIVMTGARGILPSLKHGDTIDHRITGLGGFATHCVTE